MSLCLVYGIQFDLSYDTAVNENKPTPSECWQNNLKQRMDEAFTVLSVRETQETAEYGVDDGAYMEGVSDSKSWLLSLVESLLLSLFFWQPVTIYFMTWAKIWAFSYHMKLDDGVGTLIKLMMILCCPCRRRRNFDGIGLVHEERTGMCARLCGLLTGKRSVHHSVEQVGIEMDADAEGDLEAEYDVDAETHQRMMDDNKRSNRRVSATARSGRPLDYLGFYGDKELCVDDLEDHDHKKKKAKESAIEKRRLLSEASIEVQEETYFGV